MLISAIKDIRTKKVLIAAGFNSLEDIERYTRHSGIKRLLRLRGFGQLSLVYLINLMKYNHFYTYVEWKGTGTIKTRFFRKAIYLENKDRKNFIKFLDERIERSTSNQSDSAYQVVKNQFIKTFGI